MNICSICSRELSPSESFMVVNNQLRCSLCVSRSHWHSMITQKIPPKQKPKLIKRPSKLKPLIPKRKKYISYEQAWVAQNKVLIRVVKERGCWVCGESAVACLVLHHLRGKDKELWKCPSKSEPEALRCELHKCVVLCWNCHKKLHGDLLCLLHPVPCYRPVGFYVLRHIKTYLYVAQTFQNVGSSPMSYVQCTDLL